MKTTTTSATALASAANVHALVKEAFDAVGASFERFCLMAGIESLTQMLGEDVDTLAGGRYEHRPGQAWLPMGSGQGAGWVSMGARSKLIARVSATRRRVKR